MYRGNPVEQNCYSSEGSCSQNTRFPTVEIVLLPTTETVELWILPDQLISWWQNLNRNFAGKMDRKCSLKRREVIKKIMCYWEMISQRTEQSLFIAFPLPTSSPPTLNSLPLFPFLISPSLSFVFFSFLSPCPYFSHLPTSQNYWKFWVSWCYIL